MEKRTEINAAVSGAKCNFKGKHSLKVNVKKSCSTKVKKDQGGGGYIETDVMVESISSTTEYSPQRLPEKLLNPTKSVAPGQMLEASVLARKHRNEEKDKYSRIPKTHESKSRSHDSRQHSSGWREKRIRSKHKRAQFTFKRDKASQIHTSTKKHLPRETTRGEPEVSSSSLVSTLSGHPLPASPLIRSESSNNFDRKSEPSIDNLVFLKKCEKTAAENYKGNQMDSGEHEETNSRKKSRNENDCAPCHGEGGEGSMYEKIVEMKVKEIRNNLKRMSREFPRTLVGSGSGNANSELKHKKDKIHEDNGEPNIQTAVLPSSRCCSPPCRPTHITKYWSDADETEDESDTEKHMMHVNSVNIVLNFLKNNSDKYYKEGREAGTENRSGGNKQAKHHIKERLSYHPQSDLQQSRSKAVRLKKHNVPDRRDVHPKLPGKKRHAGSRVQEHRSPPRRHHSRSSRARSPFLRGQSSAISLPSLQTDQWSRSPLKHTECHDRNRSLQSSPYHNKHRHSGSHTRSSPYNREHHRHRSRSRSSPYNREHRHSRSHSRTSPHHGERHHDSRSHSHSYPYRKEHRHSRLHSRSSPNHREHHHSRSHSHSSPDHREHHGRSCLRSSPYHREHHHSKSRSRSSPYQRERHCHSRSRSSQDHQEYSLRHRGSLSPRWHGDHRNRWSNSSQRDRSFPGDRGSHSPRNIGRSLRESHTPTRYREDFHRNKGLDSSRHKEGTLRDRALNEEGPLREEDTFALMNKGFSPLWSLQDHQEYSLRHRGLPSPHWHEGHRNRWSHSPQRKRSFSRDRGSLSPRNTGGNLRESHSASRYIEGFHSDKESHSPSRHKEGPLRKRGLQEEGSLREEPFSLLNEELSSPRSWRSPQRTPEQHAHCIPKEPVPHRTELIRLMEEFRFPPLNSQEEPLQDYENQGIHCPSDLVQPHAQLWEQNCILIQQDHSPQFLPHPNQQIPSPRHSHGYESTQLSRSPRRTAELYADAMRQNLGPRGCKSGNNERDESPRWQLGRQGTDDTLSLRSGKGAKMTSDSSGHSGRERKFHLLKYDIYGRQQKRKKKNVCKNSDYFLNPAVEDSTRKEEYQIGYGPVSEEYGQREERYLTQGSILGISSEKNTQSYMTTLGASSDTPQPIHLKEVSSRDSGSHNQGNFRLNTQMKVITVDDEPTIDQPEEYLKVSSTVATYHRLSFVPDVNDRQKLTGFIETSESAKTREALSLPGPSGITGANCDKGKDKDLLYWLSDSECDQELEDLKYCLPQVDSPHTASQEVGISDGDIANTINTLALSSAQDMTIEAVEKREKAFLTLNAAEMNTLLALIELAKEHTATGDGVSTVPNNNNTNSRNISSSLGDQSGSDKEQTASMLQVSGYMQDKTVDAENSSTSTYSNSTRSDRNNEKRQGEGKNIAHSSNKIPVGKGKKGKISSKTADSLSKTKNNNRSSQGQGNEASVKRPVSKITCSQSLKKKANDITLQEQGKDTEQLSKDRCDVKRTLSKKNTSSEDQGDRQFNGRKIKRSKVERIFGEMQHVTVCVGDLSGCDETVAQSRRGKPYKVKRTTSLRSPKKKSLKQVGKRIFVRDSSDSSDEGIESPEAKKAKDASPVAGSSSQNMHPLYRETIILDYSVNACLACKHNFVLDEYTSVSLNTGTVTIRCRICRTYTRMEKVMSPDFAKMSTPKKVVSQTKATYTNETSGTSINVDNRVNKEEDVISVPRQNEDAGLNKETRKKAKHSSRGIKNTMNERKIGTPSYTKELQKNSMSVGDEIAQRNMSVSKTFKEYKKDIKSRKENERSLHKNKDKDSETTSEEQESQSDFSSIDPSLCLFPWTSSRKRKKIHENLKFSDDSSDEDEA